MAGRHIRYNVAGKYFEYSLSGDALGPWTMLDISGNVPAVVVPPDLVSGPASAVNDDVVLFSGVTGKLIKDSGIGISKVARNDIANTFALRQTFIGAPTGGNNPQAEFKANATPGIAGVVFNDPNQAANIRKWRAITLGSDLLFDQVSDDESVQNWLGARFYRNQGLSVSGWLSLGSGNIYFPAAQNANAGANVLDDYEEGNFTPFFQTSDGNVTGTSYSLSVGRYVKIGRLVNIIFDVALNALGSAPTGNLYLTGIPFVIDPGGAFGQGTVQYFNSIAGALISINPVPAQGSSLIVLYFKNQSSPQVDAVMQGGNLNASTRMAGGVTYMTAS